MLSGILRRGLLRVNRSTPGSADLTRPPLSPQMTAVAPRRTLFGLSLFRKKKNEQEETQNKILPRVVPAGSEESKLLDDLKQTAPNLHKFLTEPTPQSGFFEQEMIDLAKSDPGYEKAWVCFLRDLKHANEHNAVIEYYENYGPKLKVTDASFIYLSSLGHHPGHLHALLRRNLAALTPNGFGGGEKGTVANPLYLKSIRSPFQFAQEILIVIFYLVFLFVLIKIVQRHRGEGGDSAPLGVFMNKSFSRFTEQDVSVKFDDILGNDEAKEELVDLVEFLKSPEKFESVKMPKGVLLHGLPGTGKTMLAKALAGEAGVPFLAASGSEFEEMFVGVGASRIRKLFEEAIRLAPCIIFIDEIDALGNRNHRMSQASAQSINEILSQMDGFHENDGIIVIGATNSKQRLDPALLRPGRFDRKVMVRLPPVHIREEMLLRFLEKHPLHKDINIRGLALQTMGMSGADLANLANWAAIMRIKSHAESITTDMIEEAFLNTQIGKKTNLKLTDKQKIIAAYHESGHALSSLYTPGSNSISRATIIPRGDALGFVSYADMDEVSISKTELNAQLRSALGGRVAEELIFGADNITTGASNDFKQALNIAYMMVNIAGMSELGILYRPDYKRGTDKEIEKKVQEIIEEAKKDVLALLTERKEEHHRLASALLRYEVLNADEIEKVIKGEPLEHRGTVEPALSFSPDHTSSLADTLSQLKGIMPELFAGVSMSL